MIKARVSIVTQEKEYAPGEVITEQLAKADYEYLKRHGFIEVDNASEPISGIPQKAENVKQTSEESGFGIDDDFPDDGEDEIIYLDESELSKMDKKEIVVYAANIGLDLSVSQKKDELINDVLNFTEEKAAQ